MLDTTILPATVSLGILTVVLACYVAHAALRVARPMRNGREQHK